MSLFAQVRHYAREHGLPCGEFGICPICQGPSYALVRIGLFLVVDPCGHAILRLPYLDKLYQSGRAKHTRGEEP